MDGLNDCLPYEKVSGFILAGKCQWLILIKTKNNVINIRAEEMGGDNDYNPFA